MERGTPAVVVVYGEVQDRVRKEAAASTIQWWEETAHCDCPKENTANPTTSSLIRAGGEREADRGKKTCLKNNL